MTPTTQLWFRTAARKRIAQAIRHHAGKPEFDVVMALGKACTAKNGTQHKIWNEEARRAIAALATGAEAPNHLSQEKQGHTPRPEGQASEQGAKT